MGRLKQEIVIGIDPGGAHTGIVIRHGKTLDGSKLVGRKTGRDGKEPVEQYAQRCASIACAMGVNLDGGTPVFKIERVIPPRWYIKGKERPVQPKNLIDVSIVAGTIAGKIAALYGDDAVHWVRPSCHGKTPPLRPGRQLDHYMHTHYPSDLLPKRKGTKYTDERRHLRSAWDVSKARHDFKGNSK